MINFLRNNRSSTLSLETQFGKEVIQYKLLMQIRGEKSIVHFPLNNIPVTSLLKSEDNKKIAALEILYMDGLLASNDSVYALKYEDLYSLDEDLLEVLDIPSTPTSINVNVDAAGLAGTPNFKFKISLSHGKYGNLNRFATRFGPILKTDEKELLLLEKETYLLLKAIDNPPENSDTEEQLRYIAKVKKLGGEATAEFSSYLAKENYTFIDEVEIDAILESTHSISLAPKYKSDDQSLDSTLDHLSRNGRSYDITNTNNKRNRVIVSKTASDYSKKIKETPKIENGDVPRFAQNPLAYIPEMELETTEMNLKDFGERVKDLGIRVYDSQPYIHGTENERGWFDFNVGIKSKDKLHSNADEEELGSGTFQDLVDEAKKKNDSYVFHDNKWFEIPPDAEEFLEVEKDLTKQLNHKKELDPTKLPYVLEIFTNLEHVEFNKPLLDIKQTLKDEGIMDPPPESFRGDLYPYQFEGFQWLKVIDYRKTGGLLADDMGLGKTVQVIAFLSYLKELERLKPSIIIAPLTLLDNWKNELQKFCSSVQSKDIYIHQGHDRLKSKDAIKSYDIVFVSYDTLVRDQLLLGKIDWMCTVCDEAQKIKNSTTATATVVKALKSKFRLALTGTPVENGLSELWSIIDYVQPGLLGSLKYFRENFEKPFAENHNKEAIKEFEDELLSKIQPVYKRRTKEEHLSDLLPKKEKFHRFVNLGPEQRKLYSDIISKVKSKELDGLQAIHALRKTCSHPALYSSEYDNVPRANVPKLEETIKILKDVKRKNEKVLIFTDYKKMQLILKRYIMEELKVNAEVINGESSHRQMLVDYFNQSEGFNVMILSPKAAGVGLTITGANHVIHYTRWWNPAVENQATDRAYRIGQKKNVKVYYPIVSTTEDNTMEQILDKLLREKENLAERVIVPSQSLDCNDELLRELQQVQ